MTKEELKKEAEEYVKENTPLFNALGKEMTYTYKYMKQAYLAGAEPREKRIAELKKENAELKSKYDTCLRENTGLKIHSAYLEKRRTEAEEIIKKLSDAYEYVIRFETYADKEVLTKAKQFIKGV